DFLLLFGRPLVEVLQSLTQPLLLLRREFAELRIVLQRLLLLLGRQVPILAQPLAGMRWLGGLFSGVRGCLMMLLLLLLLMLLCRAWDDAQQSNQQHNRASQHRPGLQLHHCVLLSPRIPPILMDWLSHPLAPVARRAGRNPNTARYSFPATASRQLRFLVPLSPRSPLLPAAYYGRHRFVPARC